MKIIIVGLGLIGGSFAKAIKAKTEAQVAGFDINEEAMQMAFADGNIDEIIRGKLPAADLVLIAVPPQATLNFLHERIDEFAAGCVVIDLCGVKRTICTEAEKIFANSPALFLGGHPMAGREVYGYRSSLATLYDGASMIFTPQNTPTEVLKRMKAFFMQLGFAKITYTTPEHHDEMIAVTSQLAHIVSSAYVQSEVASRHSGFSAGSFRDMTRVAKLDEFLWSELFLMNADYLAAHTGELIAKLEQFKKVLEKGEHTSLIELLRKGREIKESIS